MLTALAMCAVVLLALAGTAYLAVFFNRRAKADLQAALDPLAEVVDGTVDLDEAEVSGTFAGYPAFGRMANASEGPGRVFQVDLLDSAGGVPWVYTSNQNASSGKPPMIDYTGPDDLRDTIHGAVRDDIRSILDPDRERFRLEYLRDQGFLRLVRSMGTRRDIPGAESFRHQLGLLATIAEHNRPYMERHGEEMDPTVEQERDR